MPIIVCSNDDPGVTLTYLTWYKRPKENVLSSLLNFNPFKKIEDLTQALISWQVEYISYEMTMSVRFCLSYDHLNIESGHFPNEKLHCCHGDRHGVVMKSLLHVQA